MSVELLMMVIPPLKLVLAVLRIPLNLKVCTAVSGTLSCYCQVLNYVCFGLYGVEAIAEVCEFRVNGVDFAGVVRTNAYMSTCSFAVQMPYAR